MANPELGGYWFNVDNIEYVGPITGYEQVGGSYTFEVGLVSGKRLPFNFNNDQEASSARNSLTSMLGAGGN